MEVESQRGSYWLMIRDTLLVMLHIVEIEEQKQGDQIISLLFYFIL